MKLKVKLMPAIMTVLSALYFIYVLSSEDTTLSADAVGGDPGGKVLPMAMAIFMFIGFLYITFTDRPKEEKVDVESRWLFIITLSVSVLYVLLIRQIGFVVLSTILVYSLEYIYTTIDETRDKKKAILGGFITTVVTVFAYFIMRTITRNFMSFGRTGVFPAIFASATFEALISLIYVALITFVLKIVVCKRLNACGMKRISNAGILTMATVLFLYVVFKQFFSVNLAAGILNF